MNPLPRGRVYCRALKRPEKPPARTCFGALPAVPLCRVHMGEGKKGNLGGGEGKSVEWRLGR